MFAQNKTIANQMFSFDTSGNCCPTPRVKDFKISVNDQSEYSSLVNKTIITQTYPTSGDCVPASAQLITDSIGTAYKGNLIAADPNGTVRLLGNEGSVENLRLQVFFSDGTSSTSEPFTVIVANCSNII